MYNLKYTVPFTDVDGHDYEVRILVDGWSGSSSELTGAASPFVVDVSDEQFLYVPTRFSGATLNIVGSDYLQDLFSTEYQLTKVDLYRGQDLLWTGFVTPDSYSQEYDSELFELGIECISAMSTLEYIDFSLSSDMPTFKELILDCISKSNGSYKHVYVPNTYDVDLSELSVSRSNFFDEDDKPMTMKEILEEICKFLGWTCTEMNGYVCFIDVDYISGGNTTYTDLLTGNTVDLSSAIDVTDKVSKSVDNTMSILGGYNKVTVIASDYEIDDNALFPDIDKAKSGYAYMRERYASKDGSLLVPDGNKYKYGFIRYLYKYYGSSKVKLTKYKYTGSGFVVDPTNYDTSAGASILYQATVDQENKPTSLSWEPMYEIKLFDGADAPEFKFNADHGWSFQPANSNTYLDSWLIQPVNNTISDISVLLKPTIEYESPNYITFPLNTYLGISFSAMLTPVKPSSGKNVFRGVPADVKVDSWLKDVNLGEMVNDVNEHSKYYFLPIKLQIGDKYWNGSSWTTDSNSVFRCYLDVDKKTQLIGEWLNVKNTNDYNININGIDDAYVIPIDPSVSGKFKMTVFVPYFEMPWKSKNNIYIKNLKVRTGISSSIWDDSENNKRDTKYTNVVNDRFVNEADDVELKLTSSNESNVSLSKVVRNNQIINKLPHKLFDGIDKPEELIIKRIVNQYNKQKVAILYNIDNSIDAYSLLSNKYMQGKKFIYTGGQIDFAANSIECNMIELF